VAKGFPKLKSKHSKTKQESNKDCVSAADAHHVATIVISLVIFLFSFLPHQFTSI